MIECYITRCPFHTRNHTCNEVPFVIDGIDISLKPNIPINMVKCYDIDEERFELNQQTSDN